MEMRRHKTSLQSATTEAYSQRPAANITHAGIVKVLGAFHLRLAIAGDQIDHQQFGSVKGTSTLHALIEIVHRWKAAFDSSGTTIRILHVDFSKAFDRVNHHILLTKCASLGLPNVITKWLTSFLCQRKQRVKIGSVKSKFTTINAGVP